MKSSKFCGIFLASLLLFSGCSQEKTPLPQQENYSVPQEEYESYLYGIQWNSFPGLVSSPFRYHVESELEAPRKQIYENEELQKQAAELFPEHKLETKAQITEYAKLLLPILEETGCFPPQEMEARKAIHYSNHIWLFIYRTMDWQRIAGHERKIVYVYMDDTDGHICKIETNT